MSGGARGLTSVSFKKVCISSTSKYMRGQSDGGVQSSVTSCRDNVAGSPPSGGIGNSNRT